MNDWNTRVIEEFRANGGKVEQFKHVPLLLLHHTGAKSGRAYVNPLAYLADGERKIIFASKAGADTNPDWYHNLVAHPDVKFELGDGSVTEVRAVVLEGEERDEIYERQAKLVPSFAEYREKTSRKIPVIALQPV
jgi:deazaflavin-dependent oxidoreductase (nitroreductase family)